MATALFLLRGGISRTHPLSLYWTKADPLDLPAGKRMNDARFRRSGAKGGQKISGRV